LDRPSLKHVSFGHRLKNNILFSFMLQFQNFSVDKDNEKILENPENLAITYKDKRVKIGDLTEDEKIDCISRLWLYKEVLENEMEILQEMIQKMYFFGKMEKIEDEESD